MRQFRQERLFFAILFTTTLKLSRPLVAVQMFFELTLILVLSQKQRTYLMFFFLYALE